MKAAIASALLAVSLAAFSGCASFDSKAQPPPRVTDVGRYEYVATRMTELQQAGKDRDQAFRQATQEWPGEVARRAQTGNDWAYEQKRAEASAAREKFEKDLTKSERSGGF